MNGRMPGAGNIFDYFAQLGAVCIDLDQMKLLIAVQTQIHRKLASVWKPVNMMPTLFPLFRTYGYMNIGAVRLHRDHPKFKRAFC
ncbi:hypothetical protein D3C73_708650 [compost metagenome]